MFQSVIEQQEWRARRLGTGAGVSLLVHAGAIAVVMVISTRVVEEVKKDPDLVVHLQAHPRGTPTPAVTQKVAEPPKPKQVKPKQKMVMPTAIKPLPTDPPPVAPVEDPPDEGIHDPTARPDGDPSVVPCLKCMVGSTPTPTEVEPPVEETVPFSMGTMTPPVLMSGTQLQYTREALEAHVSGLLIAKCVITRGGDVENCRIIKGLPHMNEAVLSALASRHYTPVTYQGKPISVSYIFNVKLDLPR
jgi:protein TonB